MPKLESIFPDISGRAVFLSIPPVAGLWTSGQLSEALRFLRRHPKVLGHITLLSASSTSGEQLNLFAWKTGRTCKRNPEIVSSGCWNLHNWLHIGD